MPKLNFKNIGSNLELDKSKNNLISDLEEKLEENRKKLKAGWGEKYEKRVHDKNKLTAWERIAYLCNSNFLPINTFVNFEREDIKSPSAGVLTGFSKIDGKWLVIIANDNTVASGSWWPKTPEKIIRAQEIALKLKLPIIYLVDCSGLYLPEQRNSFPGKFGAGKIFKMNALLSDAGVPQICGVMGDCIAGGGYMPIISDKVIMTEQAYMVIAGAAVIQGSKSQNFTSHDIGGPNIHVHLSNCADMRAPDDKTCLDMIREEISNLSSSAKYYYNYLENKNLENKNLKNIMPERPGQIYNTRDIIARLIDDSLFAEYFKDFGQEVITGVAKINGLYVGIVANNQEATPDPNQSQAQRNLLRPGGILYKEGVSKLSLFSRACNDDGIPIVWLHDVSGFDVGAEAEKQGLLAYGSSLIYANSNNTTPMLSLLLRKASGAGYYAMAGMPYDPVLQLSTVATRLSVMEGKTLALGAYHAKLSKLESNQKSDIPEEIKTGMAKIEEQIESDMNPYVSASQMDTDEIIKFDEIRGYLEFFAESSYQTQSVRRIKNPRIWSLHDLEQVAQQRKADCHLGFEPGPRVKGSAKSQKSKPVSQNSITAPMSGLIYLRPSPQEEPFVRVGDKISPDQTVAIIEVMKNFYPVKANKSGEVKEVAKPDGSAVNAGDVFIFMK